MNFINKVMDLAKVDKLNKKQLELINEYLDNKSALSDRANMLTIFILIVDAFGLRIDSILTTIFTIVVIAIMVYVFSLYIKIYNRKKKLIQAIKEIAKLESKKGLGE